jgi:DNA-binding CsgD family transcriptional regulator
MAILPRCGRTDELAAVASSWENMLTDGGGPRIVAVTGDAGSGKTRLVAEAVAMLRPGAATVLSGRARTHSPAPYDWIASALSGQVTAASGVVPGDALAWLTQSPDAPARRFVPDALLRVASDLVRSLIGTGPGLLVVEDLHDLDPASLALIAELSAEPLPALFLVTTRSPDEGAYPALAARVLGRLAGTARSVTLDLPGGEPSALAEEAARTHAELAACLTELGRPAEARRHRERAALLLRGGRQAPGASAGEQRKVTGALAPLSCRTSPIHDLTAREREVLGCMASGMTNQQVARSLGISIRTVAVHVSRVLRKTGSASRTEAALWAVRRGAAS